MFDDISNILFFLNQKYSNLFNNTWYIYFPSNLLYISNNLVLFENVIELIQFHCFLHKYYMWEKSIDFYSNNTLIIILLLINHIRFNKTCSWKITQQFSLKQSKALFYIQIMLLNFIAEHINWTIDKQIILSKQPYDIGGNVLSEDRSSHIYLKNDYPKVQTNI